MGSHGFSWGLAGSLAASYVLVRCFTCILMGTHRVLRVLISVSDEGVLMGFLMRSRENP